jgi:ABC-2 type transport system ATP-binding protein
MIISLNGISKSIDKTEILKDITIEIYNNSIVGLVGPNGSGKTTFLNILLGLIRPNVGTITKCNDIEIGLAIGLDGFFNDLNVVKNLKILNEIRGSKPKNNNYMDILQNLGFTEYEKKFRHLSLGNKQKVNIASAFIGNPKLIILDEPYNGLDIDSVFQLRDIIISQKEISSFIITSHNLNEIEKVADRILLIRNGSVILNDTTENILRNYENLESQYKNLK